MNKTISICTASSTDFAQLKKILDNTHTDWSPAMLSDCFSSDYFIWMIGDLNHAMGFIVVKNNVDFWEILQMVIDQPYQRRGLASQLLKFLIAEARQKQIKNPRHEMPGISDGKENGHFLKGSLDPALKRGDCASPPVQKIELEVRASNLSAITLYEKTGFVRVGFRRKYYSNGEDAVLMDFIL